jgi:hypothetical protein
VQEEKMKYICLGYFGEKKWEALSETERRRSKEKKAS